MTRFVDALVKKKLVKRINTGKVAFIYPSSQGEAVQAEVAKAYQNLYLRYARILGPEAAALLSHQIAQANTEIKQGLEQRP